MYPAPHIHEHFTIHKWLRQTAYILTHNMNKLEHIANNCMTTTMHTDANIAQFWARRAPSVDAHVFIHRTCGSSLALCVIPCHPCMRTCVWCLECSLFARLSTSSSSSSPSSSWCLPWCLMRSPWKIPCATPASGAWSLWTMSIPSQVSQGWSSQTHGAHLAQLTRYTSDIYFQHTLDDTASFPNDPDDDDDELAEFLAVVVDRTGQPVEVRSNNDQFSCDIRNLKSAQSQFPLVTQPKRMISQTGGSVEERIPEERESSNAQIRTMLNEQRRTIIAEYGEKVLHHELLAAQAEQDRKILQKKLIIAATTGFSWSSSARSYETEGIAKIPKFYLRWVRPEEIHWGSEDYYGIIWKTSRTTEWSKLHEWYQGFSGCWVDLQWKFTRYQSTWIIPRHPPFEGLLKPAFISQRQTEEPPNIRDTSGKSGNIFAHPQTSSSAPYPQELNSTWRKTIEEPIHMSTAEKSGRPERDPDLRCQSGPSAKDSVIFSGRDTSKNYGADQQRLQISDLHFDKFPTPATFACWR